MFYWHIRTASTHCSSTALTASPALPMPCITLVIVVAQVVGCIVEHEGKILLCKRAIEPCKGKWTLPAGYMELKESSAGQYSPSFALALSLLASCQCLKSVCLSGALCHAARTPPSVTLQSAIDPKRKILPPPSAALLPPPFLKA